MKNRLFRIITIFLVLLFVAASVPANEVSAVWTRLFRRSVSLSQKSNIMASIVEQHNRDMIPVLMEALEEQVGSLEGSGDVTARLQVSDYTKMIIKELGRLKANEAATYIWQIVEAVDDPFLKGEAIIALGKVGARQYTNKLNLLLRNLNFNLGNIQDQRKNEIVAFALVIALERLKQPESYSPLFFASTGWYSSQSGVRAKAGESMLTILDDPTEQLMQIIKDNKEYDIKLAALVAGSKSKAGDANKAALAVLALSEGLQASPMNPTEKIQLKSLRVLALNVLETVSVKPEEAIPYMNKMLIAYRTERLFEIDEMVDLFETFGTFPSDTSVKAQTEFLAYLTDRKESGRVIDLRISKSSIIAIGNTRNPLGFEELTNVQYSDSWENSVKREAKNALSKLK
ncbi:MAG: PBS lyase [Spirochaetes bacterium]|nr:MAG: PBS lyase [Spirochaetota bacterium]